MKLPDHLMRYPSAAAAFALAERFGLPNSPAMQDWAWEVADPARIDEFVHAYHSAQLSDDEKFVLMDMILQSFEEHDGVLASDPRWAQVTRWLDENVELHASTIWYWAQLQGRSDGDIWRVVPDLRRILEGHRETLALAIG